MSFPFRQLVLYDIIVNYLTCFSVPGQGMVANLQPQQVNVGGALLTQPGVAQPTVYSLQTSQPSLQQQHSYPALNAQQIQVANVQVRRLSYLISSSITHIHCHTTSGDGQMS